MDRVVVTAVRAATHEEVLGGIVGFNAGIDARYLSHDGDIPTVLFGPGHIEHDTHTERTNLCRQSRRDGANVQTGDRAVFD